MARPTLQQRARVPATVTLTLPQAMQQALAAYQRGDWAEAERLCQVVLGAKSDYFDALNLRGAIAAQTGRTGEATSLLAQAVAINPTHADAHNNLGNALRDLRRHDDALACYERALQFKAGYADAYNNRGIVLRDLRRYSEALASYDLALKFKPGYAEAHNNRGVVLKDLDRAEEALIDYDHAIRIRPDYAEAHLNRGNALCDLKRFALALASYASALKLKPNHDFLFGTWLHTQMRVCAWHDYPVHLNTLNRGIAAGKKVTPLFSYLALSDSLPLQRQAAQIMVQDRYPTSLALGTIAKYPRHEKIRVGYFSADLHNHATAYLMAELFEKHDRSQFELTAFSFGPGKNDDMRERLAAAFDRFIDARHLSDKEIAQQSRALELDIAVDLKGFTLDSRPGIFAHRAAPIQVSYLGYPGTMGAEYIDYLIADATLITAAEHPHYTEKIVTLPDSYQVNDAHRPISDRRFTRRALGLPDSGFVFCCFNNNHKITPATFDGWMRILAQVQGSVLWLLEDNDVAAGNLRREAVQRGVSAERLIFAKRMPLAEHLARHRAADLFLDTLPYNAHTTASDALWAGLPVLTCTGASFASRVAASLLTAIQLPELITATQDAYEALAVTLARDSQRLQQISQKLAANRLTAPLFDTERFTRHIENAYTQMVERYQADLPTAHFKVRA